MRWQETQVTHDTCVTKDTGCLYILQAGLRETAPQRSRPHSQPKCRSTPRPSCMVDATHLIVNSETPGHHHRPFHYSKRHTQWPERQHMRNATRATSRRRLQSPRRHEAGSSAQRPSRLLRDAGDAQHDADGGHGWSLSACARLMDTARAARTKPLPPRAHHRRRPRPTRLRRPRVGRWVHERARGRTWRARLGQRRAAGTWQAHL